MRSLQFHVPEVESASMHQSPCDNKTITSSQKENGIPTFEMFLDKILQQRKNTCSVLYAPPPSFSDSNSIVAESEHDDFSSILLKNSAKSTHLLLKIILDLCTNSIKISYDPGPLFIDAAKNNQALISTNESRNENFKHRNNKKSWLFQ